MTEHLLIGRAENAAFLSYALGSLVLILAASVLLAAPTQAITLNDGLTHTVDATNSFPFEAVIAEDGPGVSTTTVNLVAGGEIGTITGDNLEGFGASVLNVSGGEIGGDLFAREDTQLQITGGEIIGTTFVRQGSTASISGGIINALEIRGGFADGADPEVVISGGSISLAQIGGNIYGHEQVDILGGVFGFLETGPFAGGLSEVRISAGQFGGIQTAGDTSSEIFGGTFTDDLLALDNSVVTIHGSGFNFPLGDIAATSGTLTGFLADGVPLDLPFSRASTARITIVPEPSTALLLGCGLMALAAGRRWR